MEDRRKSTRFEVSQATIMEVDGKEIAVKIQDVSFGGTLISCEATLAVGTKVTMRDPRFGTVNGEVIRNSDGEIALALEETEGSAAYALKSITLEMVEGK